MRRAALLGLAVEAAVSAGQSNADIASLIAKWHDFGCFAEQGFTCPYALPRPSFSYPDLRIGDVLLRRFKRRCKQTELLEVFELQRWPYAIENPFRTPSPLDPENGISDVLYELNLHQAAPLRIHFWSASDRVRWEIQTSNVHNFPSLDEVPHEQTSCR